MIVCVYLILFSFLAPQITPIVKLTSEEKAYLQRKGTIKMVVDPNWMPIESLDENGVHVGIAADFFKLISERAGLDIKVIPTESWSESLIKAQQRKADLISLAAITPNREVFWNFSNTLFEIQTVIATLDKVPPVSNLEEIIDKQIGIMRGYSHVEIFRKRYPGIHIVEIDSYEEGLAKLLGGEVYGVIGNMATIGYAIQKEKINNIKIAGRVDDDVYLHVAVRNDEPELLSIINKAIETITESERQDILNHFLSVRFEQKTDYSLLFKTISVVLILFVFVIYWVLKMQKLNKELNHANAQLEDLNKQKDYFFSIIGHDLRNPFMGIMGYSAAIRDEFETLNQNEVQHFADNIYTKSNQILTMLNQLLEWAKLELNQIHTINEPVDAHKLVDYLSSVYELNAKQKSVTIKNLIPIATIIDSDTNILSTILGNLLSNAIKFTPEFGEIEIGIIMAKKTTIYIKDFGVGMSPEKLKKLFKLDELQSTVGTDNEQGTGLGLLICKRLSIVIEAELRVESELKKGTTFYLDLA